MRGSGNDGGLRQVFSLRQILYIGPMRTLILLLGAFIASPTLAQTQWSVTEGDHIVRDFAFVTGEALPELRIHYRTLGTPHRDAEGRIDNAVIVLHGTGGSGAQFLSPQFADELYGPGQPLDIARYYIILPDGIGHGGSSKPSDGLRAAFPRYDYADMVEAQRRLLVDGLGVERLRLLIGTSMGCMHGFIWGETHPQMIQAMLPLACMPIEIAGLNRMWRMMIIDGLLEDPGYQGGNYETQPAQGMRNAANILTIAGAAPLLFQEQWPTREASEAEGARRVTAAMEGRDANDMIRQFDSSRSYNPEPGLERITMPVTWINSEDDFINPSNFGFVEGLAARMPQGRLVLVPETVETRGHGTHTWARFWRDELVALMARSE